MEQVRTKALVVVPILYGSNSPMAEGDPIRIIPRRGVDDNCGSAQSNR